MNLIVGIGTQKPLQGEANCLDNAGTQKINSGKYVQNFEPYCSAIYRGNQISRCCHLIVKLPPDTSHNSSKGVLAANFESRHRCLM